MMSLPNIIFILCDDIGYGDLGCYGQKVIPTPRLDQLASESMRFTQCYTGSPICAPSRAVLMTGLHSGHTRVRDNMGIVGGVGEQKRVPLEPEDFTVAEMLKEAGYTTGITGKWGLGEPDTTGIPTRKGFDEWFGYLNQRNAHSYYPPYLWHNEEKVILKGNLDSQENDYSHDMIFDFACGFIRDNSDGPFFLYLPWTLPHGRYEIPDASAWDGKPWTDDEKVYAAMITKIDTQVGQIADLLRELDIKDNTLLFFGSDHGAARRWEPFGSCGALRGQKGTMYEGGLRTPMIVHWPARIPAGTVSDQVWYYADFMPTVADVIGTDAPDNMDGVSILPTLLDESRDIGERFLYWERFGGGFKQAVRWKNWKAVRNPSPRLLDEPLELYDLDRDIGEENNVAADHPDVIAEIENFMKDVRIDSPNWPIGVKGSHG
ncbi:MAG: arylsulfatase [Gemmatimonadetes bacterium]|nr:arylsulfatase [Gemmatimonadota bacterium]